MTLDLVQATRAGHPGVDQWDAIINEKANKFKVPPNLVKAHILYESGGDAHVVSFDNGCGLCQITSGVVHKGDQWLYEGQNILDPAFNIEVACRNFIAPNIAAFPHDIDAIVAAYNAGIGAVETALSEGRDPSSVTYSGNYVSNVRGAYEWFCAQSHAASKG